MKKNKYFFRLLFLMVAFWIIPLSQSLASPSECRGLKDFQTAINFHLETPPPSFDYSKSLKEMNAGEQAAHATWLKKNGMDAIWQASSMETEGKAMGGWGLISNYTMTWKPMGRAFLHVCPYYKSIDVAIMYRTIIMIPKEYAPGSCSHKVILEHELKHHATNEAIVKSAVARFQKDMPLIVSYIERSVAAIEPRQAESKYQDMQEDLKNAFSIYLETPLKKEMSVQNAKIDSPEEYARGSKLLEDCRHSDSP